MKLNLFIFFFLSTYVLKTISAQQYEFRHYSVGDGLAQSQVFAMLEDHRGYLWMGTRGGGISQFDGTHFRTYSKQDGLINNYVLSLLESSEKEIWIGTNAGLSRYNGLAFQSFLLDENEPVAVGSILQRKDGSIWLGTSKGVYQFDGQSFIHFNEESTFPQAAVSCLYEDSQETLWIGHDEGLTRIEEDTVLNYGRRSGLKSNLIRCMDEDVKGNIWVGTYGGGLHRQTGERFLPVLQEGGLNQGLVFDMLFDNQEKLWVGTQNSGAAVWDTKDSTLIFLDEKDGLTNNHVHALLEDSWGNHWLGTSGGGVSKYFGQQFEHFDRNSGLPGRYVYSVMEDIDCNIWMGISGRGLAVFNGNDFTLLNGSNGFTNIKVKSLFQDSEERVWIGTEGGGITIKEDSVMTTFTTKNGLSGNWIRDIVQDERGYIYIATAGGGITRMIPEVDSTGTRYRFNYYRKRQGLPQNRINDLHLDKQNRLWFATANQGIGFIQPNGKVVTIPANEGTSSNSIRSLAEDESGYLWMGTAGAGIARLSLYPSDEDTVGWEMIFFEQGLTSGNVYLLTLDEQQRLWIGTESGLDRASLDDERNIIEIKHFGKSEGFVGIETCQNSVCRDREGNLWFGTINGLTKYNPRTSIRNLTPPKVSISQVSLFYEPLKDHRLYGKEILAWGQVAPNLQFQHNRNHLSFDFTGINHTNPEQVRYQWKLEGSETGWSPVSSKHDATYSNLPPGDYRFFVRAVNEDGVWSESTKVSFNITPPFWQTWWFVGAATFVILGSILWIFTARLNQVKRKARQERERLEMEKDLVELEQKALRLQMNPHFIFNALNSIQGMITLEDPQTARYYLAKFSKLMRAVLENSRETMIPLEAEIQSLEDYLAIEQFSSGNKFDYDLEIGPWIDQETYLIPPMMIQPFVENAIVHGVAHLSQKGKINLKFSLSDELIECEITDNGVGRERAAQIKSQQEHHHKSTGLVVTQERLDILNADKRELRSIEMVDLVAADGSAAGTKVIVRIPVEEE